MNVEAKRRPLRVAQFIETLETGGAEHLAIQIANGRAAAGDASHLYVMRGPGALSPRIAPDVRVRYLRFERASIGAPPRFAASLLRGSRMLRSRMDEDRIDVLQTHLPGSNYWGLLLRLLGVRGIVPTIHNNQEFGYGESVSGFRMRLRRAAYGLMLRRCPATVCVSEMVKRSMIDELGLDPGTAARMAVVPNGVPVPARRDAAVLAATRERYGVPADSPFLLAAGRHTEQKDFRTLIDAVGRLRASGRRPRLVLAGDGPLRESLRAQAEAGGLAGTVILPGNVEDLGDLFQAADMFVMSSLWEGLPLVLLEALASGCAVVGTRISGIDEILGGGEGASGAGLLVPPADPDALAEAVASLIDDPQRRAVLGAAGRALVEDRFSFARVDRDLGELYARVAAGRAPEPEARA